MNNLNMENLRKYKHIHLIGIGGISMSGISELLKSFGFFITGSDCSRSDITDRLASHGIRVFIGHDLENSKKADLIVYSAAIKQDDPELINAKQYNIQTIERCDFVGLLTRIFEDTIGVSGTHGKTTTTSMISCCFLEAELDPTIQVGAILKQINGNYRVGKSDYFILEACEYVESFLKFSPKSEIILNIDNDHLDYFKTFDNIKNAFVKYVSLLPDDGLLVLNADDKNCLDLRKYTNARSITYGIQNEKSNFVGRNISFDNNGFPSFDVYYNNSFFATFKLSVMGIHNVQNALACIALCTEYKIPKATIKSALTKFTGAHRRFEFVGTYKGANIYDDYGHHPTEIVATAKAMKNKTYNRSWVIFQPHTYSRTKNLLDDFAKALLNFDRIIITDIYAAREQNTFNVSSQDLVNKIKELGREAIYIKKFDDIIKYVKDRAIPNDLVLTLGAGTVEKIGKKLKD